MRGQLSKETRLEISVTRLKNGMKKLREENVVLKLKLKEKDTKIADLEAKLVDKESQRKELLSYLYKPGKKDELSKPKGKKVGSSADQYQKMNQ
jgi:chromosome segregation ATPase